MNNQLLESALQKFEVSEFIEMSGEKSLARDISFASTDEIDQSFPEKLPRLGFLYERQGVLMYQQYLAEIHSCKQE